MPGVVARGLAFHEDERGYLVELFREDEQPWRLEAPPMRTVPKMGYLSVTHPGVMRGPHEHRSQSDCFAFPSGEFEITLWDTRAAFGPAKVVLYAGETRPLYLVVPPGVVHAYRNVGETDAFVLNFPDRLYRGWQRKNEVDEIRHEEIGTELAP